MKTLSTIVGKILANNEDDNSKHGLELTSISQTLKLSSIIISKPNISKQFSRFSGSILPNIARIVSVAIYFINFLFIFLFF